MTKPEAQSQARRPHRQDLLSGHRTDEQRSPKSPPENPRTEVVVFLFYPLLNTDLNFQT